jgi:hypothetical protein
MWYLVKTLESPDLRNLIISGALFAITALTRPEIMLFLPLVLLIILFHNKSFNFLQRLKQAAIVLAATLCLILPWTLRNYIVTGGHFVFISSQGGENLWMGNNPNSTGWHTDVPRELVEKYPKLVDMDKAFYGMALDFMINNPVKVLKLARIKIRDYFLYWHEGAFYLYPEKFGFFRGWKIPVFPSLLLCRLFFLGLIISFFRFRKYMLFYGLFFSNILLQVILYVEPRFRAQIMPFMIIFAAYPISLLLEKGSKIMNNSSVRRKLSIIFSKIKKFYKRIKYPWLWLLLILIIIAGVSFNRISSYMSKRRSVIIIEGENPNESNFSEYIVRNRALSGKKSLEIWEDSSLPKEGYFYSKYNFYVPASKTYSLIIGGTPPGALEKTGEQWSSPYWVSFDNERFEHITEENLAGKFPDIWPSAYTGEDYVWTKVDQRPLKKGYHSIEIRVSESRLADEGYVLCLDVIILVSEDLPARFKLKNIPEKFYR